MSASTVAESLAEVMPMSDERINGGPVRVAEITDNAGLQALHPVWNQTLERDPHATVFQTWEWQHTWHRHFGADSKPVVLLMSDDASGDKPFAIAPLTLKSYVLPGLRELNFLGVGVSDYLNMICPAHRREDGAAALFGFVESNRHRWDFVDLHQVPPEGLAGDLAELAEEHPELDGEMLHHETCPVIELPDSWEEYRKSLGKSLRSNIGYYERSLRKQYDVEIGLADRSSLDSEMESLFRLHTQRWRKRWLPGVLSGRKVRHFHKDAAARLLDQGWLRLYYLKLNGVTQASLYCFAFRDTVSYYLGGFEPELAKYGLGTILTGHAIREAIESGCTRFDMLRGCEDYKLRWKPELRRNTRVFIRKKTLRSKTVRGMHVIEGHAERVFKERIMGIREK